MGITYSAEMGRLLWLMSAPQQETARKLMGRDMTYVSSDLIRELPTLSQGHMEDLKLEWCFTDSNPLGRLDDSSHYRVWVSRMTKEDGAAIDHAVTVEHRYLKGFRYEWGWRNFTRAR